MALRVLSMSHFPVTLRYYVIGLHCCLSSRILYIFIVTVFLLKFYWILLKRSSRKPGNLNHSGRGLNLQGQCLPFILHMVGTVLCSTMCSTEMYCRSNRKSINTGDFKYVGLESQVLVKEPGSINGQQFIIERCKVPSCFALERLVSTSEWL